METCLSKWKIIGCLLISISFLMFTNASSDAATRNYTLSINSAASIVHTSGGFSGGGMGDLPVSGTFQAVVTDGVINFQNIDVTIPEIVPSYPGSATQAGTSLSFSGAKAYENLTGGGNFSGSTNGTAFAMIGNFNAPCCDQYNYQFVLNGTVVSVSENITINITASVDEVNDASNLLGGKIKIGDVITGSYTYNTSTPDTNPLTQIGDYWYHTSPYGVRINTGPWIFATDPNNVDFLVELVKDYNVGDNYLLQSYNNITTPSLAGNAIINMIAWQLDDPTQTALNSVALQPFPPVLQNWQSIFGLTVEGCLPDPIVGLCGPEQFLIRANVTSATSAADLCANTVCPAIMVCNSPLVCDPNTGQCVPGNPSCNDGDACAIDTCNPATGCVHTPIVCDDNNICTEDSCDPAIGCVFTNNAVPCNDSNACTVNDVCYGGVCAGTPINCNDNKSCTTDSCDPATGCVYAAIPGCNTVGIITTVAGNGARGYWGDNGPATSANLDMPFGVAVDSSGNIFIADWGSNRIRKVDASGTITTVAGNGTEGYSGDNGPATSASLAWPNSVAVDLSGNIYIADSYNNRIRKVDLGGTITTVAGNGTWAYSGDNGPATSASLAGPQSVAVDSSGNIYIADYANFRIRKVDTSGIITTVAGNGIAGYSGDNGPATSAKLYDAVGVAVDSSGNIYIADMDNYRIRKVNISGIITTVAGNGTSGYSGDNGPATSARLSRPGEVQVDLSGNIYIIDGGSNRIRKVDTDGTITTVAGNGTAGYSGDNGPAISASLYGISDAGVDLSGNIYIADGYNQRIRKVTRSILTCTGQPDGTPCYDGSVCTHDDVCFNGTCQGTSIVCKNYNPCRDVHCDPSAGCVFTNNTAVCNDGNSCTTNDFCSNGSCQGTSIVCSDNNACTADSCNPATGNCVFTSINCDDNDACTSDSCDPATGCVHTAITGCNAGGIITTVAGNGMVGYSGDNGPATSASLYNPSKAAVDLSGNIYIADSGNNRIRKIDKSGTITEVAGNNIYGYSSDTGPAIYAPLNNPHSVAVDLSGNIYIADTYNHCIRKIDTSGIITTVAGNGTWGYSGDNGPATSASLYYPEDVAVDSSGNIYIADYMNHRIRKVDISGTITTVAGNGYVGYSSDNGPATSASLDPTGVAVDSSGNIYIADINSHRIRKVDTSGTISTVAGNGLWGYSGDNGPATFASLNSPGGVALDPLGNIYIADYSNYRVRKVDLSGNITTVAGNGIFGYSGDNGPARSASIGDPTGLAVDSSGSIYIADSYNNRIRKVAVSPFVSCTELPDGSPCNDNNACTTNDVCSNGACKGSTIFCDDNNACTADSCDTATGCIHTAIGCDDNDACTADSCNTANGQCIHTPIVCNDNNPCTTDTCNTSMGCVYTPVNCSDNNACTADFCNLANGQCFHSTISCNDNNGCTIDSCNTATSCVHAIIIGCNAGGIITTVAGNGTQGYSGDNGPATSATINAPYDIAADSSGNIYFAEYANNRIRKINISGIITTVAGNGIAGYSGDNGPATSASLQNPSGLAVDSSGNIYIADKNNYRIRKVDASGIITTVAGNGAGGYSGDNGPATEARLAFPSGVTVDSSGNIYIADNYNHRVRKVDVSGTITTAAGNGTSGYSGDNGPATSASLSAPYHVATDSSGNIYIADFDDSRIRKVDKSGTITTVAGNGIDGYSGDNGPATSASLHGPIGVAVDASGNIYIGDTFNLLVRKVNTSGTITTVAGNRLFGSSGDNGPATSARLWYPGGVEADSLGNVYIADNGNERIRKVTWIMSCKGQPDGTPCEDGNACTSGEVCSGGACQGTAKVCDDSNPYTDDTCNTETGACVFTNNTAPCDDGNACTFNDQCTNGACVGSVITCLVGPSQCQDPGPCNNGNGTCLYPNKPNGTACNDGDLCTTTDVCTNGVCGGTPKVCPPPDACHLPGACDSTTGECRYPVTIAPTGCSDGNACTINDTCQNGVCMGTPVVCTALDQCHVAGVCDISTGACSNPNKADGTPCNDGNACTSGDACQGGVCTEGMPIACAPAPVCKVNIPCDPVTGTCSYANLPNGTSCDDGNLCNGRETCQNGICTAGTPVSCPPTPCKTSICDPVIGTCTYTNLPNGTSCADSIVCNGAETCQNGTCAPGTPLVCPAATACTLASVCDPVAGCKPAANKPDGTSCDDGQYCDGADACSNGACVHAGNPCPAGTACNELTDHCDSVDCTGRPAGTACNDNNPCTTNDACIKSGNKMACKGTATVCSDNNPCTTDACDPTTGSCKFVAVVNGAACNDGNACSVNETCQSGVCTGTPRVCNDNNLCTTDSCDPKSGCTFDPIDCSDGDRCTTDTCNPATGCVHTPKPKSVTILGSNSGETLAVNQQIQTMFTVTGSACIMGSGIDSVKVSPGALVGVNCKVGTGPNPTTGKLDGISMPVDTTTGTVQCPNDSVTVRTIYLDNLKSKGGKDVDTITLQGQDH